MTPEDRAQAIELAEYEYTQAKAIMPKPTRLSAMWCKCGKCIPEERRKAVPGTQHCVECQELEDKKKKGRYAGTN